MIVTMHFPPQRTEQILRRAWQLLATLRSTLYITKPPLLPPSSAPHTPCALALSVTGFMCVCIGCLNLRSVH